MGLSLLPGIGTGDHATGGPRVRFGVSVALLTPFDAAGAVDGPRLGAHAASLLARGLDGVTLYGTTGEGASIGRSERAAGIAALHAAGVPAARTVLGIAASAVADAAEQVREGHAAGIRAVLLPPPFYFGGAGEAGLFDWHAALLAAIPEDVQVILYHIPQVTGVRVPPALVGRLAAAFPGRIRAIKDSSGDWATARAFLDLGAVPVLVGDERLLHRAVGAGGAGAITGVANLHPERMARIVATAQEDAALSAEVDRIVAGPVIPGLKALVAAATGEPGWERVRPPLAPLTDAERAALMAERMTADG